MPSTAEKTQTFTLQSWHFTLFLAGLYVCGFAVSNMSSSEFRLVDYDLLRGKYIAAGMLFFFLTALPCSIVIAGFIFIREGLPEMKNRAQKTIFVLVGIGIFSTAVHFSPKLLQMLFLQFSNVYWGEQETRFWIQRYCFSVSLFTASTGVVFWSRSVFESMKGEAYTLLAGFICMTSLMALITLFGATLYGYVSPALGGGAAWLACIRPKESVQGDTSANQEFSSPVALLNRSEHYVDAVVIPSHSERKRSYARLLGSDNIESIKIIGIVPMPKPLNPYSPVDSVGLCPEAAFPVSRS